MGVVFETIDPRSAEVQAILRRHHTFANATSPPEHVHALDTDGLCDPAVTLFGARQDDGTLGGVGAIKHLEPGHAEVKSMHVLEEARGRGLGRAILAHLLRVADERGDGRVSLETGAMDEFAPARALYRSAGFEVCAPFGDYTVNPYSLCMTRTLARPAPAT